MTVSEEDTVEGEDCVTAVRRLAAECLPAGHRARNVAWTLAPLGVALYGHILKHNPGNPLWFNRDRLVLSWADASFWQYSLLHLSGYGIDSEDLRDFAQWRSLTPAHPDHARTPGVDASTGPAGVGLAMAVGLALAEKNLATVFNRPDFGLVDHYTFVVCQRDDLENGLALEAMRFAASCGLSKLICFFGGDEIPPREEARFEGMGWHFLRIGTPDSIEALAQAVSEAKLNRRPSLILLPLNSPEPPPFIDTSFPPPASGEAVENHWLALFEDYAQADPSSAREFRRRLDLILAQDWDAATAGEQPDKLLWRLAARCELATVEFCGSGLCGVLACGFALHGAYRGGCKIPLIDFALVGQTLRLAVQMKLPVTYFWTQDEMGEGGPSLTPVEQLAGLRVIPHFYTFRPADVTEALEAWRFALQHRGPVGIVSISRIMPNLGPIAENTRHGGYILKEASAAIPKVILISSGAELHICLEACKILESEGVPARVVSLPCWELFYEQSKDYRDGVLIPAVPRLGVEVASSFGWERWIGEKGDTLCLEGFGVSAPREVNLEKFGFTPENVAAKAKRLAEQ